MHRNLNGYQEFKVSPFHSPLFQKYASFHEVMMV